MAPDGESAAGARNGIEPDAAPRQADRDAPAFGPLQGACLNKWMVEERRA